MSNYRGMQIQRLDVTCNMKTCNFSLQKCYLAFCLAPNAVAGITYFCY